MEKTIEEGEKAFAFRELARRTGRFISFWRERIRKLEIVRQHRST